MNRASQSKRRAAPVVAPDPEGFRFDPRTSRRAVALSCLIALATAALVGNGTAETSAPSAVVSADPGRPASTGVVVASDLRAGTETADADSVTTLTLPDVGIIYVRYGAPGGVRLHRGNLGEWRTVVRTAVDSLDLAPRRDAPAAGSSSNELIAVLDAFGTSLDAAETPSLAADAADVELIRLAEERRLLAEERRWLDEERRRLEEARATEARLREARRLADAAALAKESLGPDAARALSEAGRPGSGEAVGQPSGVEGTDQAITAPGALDATGGVTGGAAAGSQFGEPATPGHTDALIVGAPPIVTSASPETLRVALLERRVVQTQAILFETGRAEILPGAEPILETLAELLRTEPDLRLRIEGHTDERGSDAFNQELSERRAGTIRTWLVVNGIEGGRIDAVGFGESRPFDQRHTIEAYALNRRVVFQILSE
ncbi:MAG: OmpA family protein [Candidatus Eisenbacteria bacterium]